MTTIRLRSTKELREAASEWNTLWGHSNVQSPVFQAELIANAVEAFHQDSQFMAVVVAEKGIWRAALPLVIDRDLTGQPVARLFVRQLVVDGLLCDLNARGCQIMESLVEELRRCRLPRVWLENVPLNSSHWRDFGATLANKGISATRKAGYIAGMVEINNSWDGYESSIQRDRRAELRRTARRLQEIGNLTFSLLEDCEEDSLDETLAKGFALEDTGWKGEKGSSILKRGMFAFFLQEATLLARRGQLRLALLELDRRPIAFGYMPFAKGTCSLVKYSYDGQYARYGPGQLLVLESLRHMFARSDLYKRLDFPGVLTPALADWANATYSVGQYALGFGAIGKSAIFFHRYLWPRLKGLKWN